MPRVCLARCAALLLFVLVSADPLAAQERRGPFTHSPRSVRTRAYDVEHTRIELSLDWDALEARGRVVHRLVPFAACRRLELDAAEMHVESAVQLVGDAPASEVPLTIQHEGTRLVLTFDDQQPAGQPLTVAIAYRVERPRRGLHFVDPDEHEPEQKRIVWTQSEPEDARYWFPCFDSPNDRLTSETLVTVPAEYFVLSNGVLAGKEPVGSDRQRWHWVQEQSHVAYLISVVAGDFVAYEQSWDGIPVISYVPPEMADAAQRAFGKTPEMLELFSRKIGYRYPWPKYAQIACDEYGGGMEHTSATTLGLRTLRDERAYLDYSPDWLVAHELAHQWWGDLLTCKDWAELWLNESFASYFETIWAEHDLGADDAAWDRHNQAQSYLDEDRRRYRRPIVSYRYNEPGAMFDRHSYPKGSRVLHMLRYVLGDEGFWRVLRHYAHKHQFQVVETADLRVAVEEVTGQGLNWFFDQWLYRGGHPQFDVRWEWDDETSTARVMVRQTQQLDELTPLFEMPLDVVLVTSAGPERRQVRVSKAEETFHFQFDERPRRVLFDPEDWILKELVFHKSKQEWLDQLAHDEHLMARREAAVALGALAPDPDAAAALVRALGDDPFWGLRAEAARLLGTFPTAAVRDALREAARQDERSDVRRAAVAALVDSPHADTSQTLREVIAHDPSYPTIAAALRTLAKIDSYGARPDLIAALDVPSDGDVVLAAACEGLVDIKDETIREKLLLLLGPPATPQRRTVVLEALAPLALGDTVVLEAMAAQLDDRRPTIRRAAANALGSTGEPRAIEQLLARRQQEWQPWVLQAIDASVARLREGDGVARLRRDLDSLREENRELKDRLERLERSEGR